MWLCEGVVRWGCCWRSGCRWRLIGILWMTGEWLEEGRLQTRRSYRGGHVHMLRVVPPAVLSFGGPSFHSRPRAHTYDLQQYRPEILRTSASLLALLRSRRP